MASFKIVLVFMCIVAVSLAAAVPAAAPKASVAQQVNAEAEQLEGSAGVEDDLKGASSYGHGYYAGGLHGGYGGYYGGHGYYPTYSTYSYYPSYYGGHYSHYPSYYRGYGSGGLYSSGYY